MWRRLQARRAQKLSRRVAPTSAIVQLVSVNAPAIWPGNRTFQHEHGNAERPGVGLIMHRSFSIWPATALSLVLTLFGAHFARAEEPATTFDKSVKPFLASYCISCHGPAKQKGERRFDELTGRIADNNGLIDLQDIVDQLNLGEMPPTKEKKQPTDDERRRVIAWLAGKIEQYRREHQPQISETVLRRLNAREYRNSIRDLLHLNMAMFDPTLGF